MFNWFNRVVDHYSVEYVDESILDIISNLELRVLKLEEENIELTNCLYEVENRLQAQIDNIHPVTYDINQMENTLWKTVSE
jgi:hypothetical protein